jgi:hypothetical protein
MRVGLLAQYRVLIPDGSEVFLDFAYPDVKLAVEADSYLWHASLAAWQRDRARNNDVVALGWSILPLTYDLVVHHRARAQKPLSRRRERRVSRSVILTAPRPDTTRIRITGAPGGGGGPSSRTRLLPSSEVPSRWIS